MKLTIEFNTVAELRDQLKEFSFEDGGLPVQQTIVDTMAQELPTTPAPQAYQEAPATTLEMAQELHAPQTTTVPAFDPNAIDLSTIATIEELDAIDKTGMSPGKKSAVTKRRNQLEAEAQPQQVAPTLQQTPAPGTPPPAEAPTMNAPSPQPVATTLPRDQWPPFDLVATDGSGMGAWHAGKQPQGVATVYHPGTNTLAPTAEAYEVANQLAAANANDPGALLTAPTLPEELPQTPAPVPAPQAIAPAVAEQQAQTQPVQVSADVDPKVRMDFIRKVATDGRVPEAQAKALEMFGEGKGVNTLTGPELTHFMAWYNGGGQ